MGNGLGDAKSLSGGAGKVAPGLWCSMGSRLCLEVSHFHPYSLSSANIHYPEQIFTIRSKVPLAPDASITEWSVVRGLVCLKSQAVCLEWCVVGDVWLVGMGMTGQ